MEQLYKNNFLSSSYLIFLGALSSFSLPPYNYFLINFITFPLLFNESLRGLKEGSEPILLIILLNYFIINQIISDGYLGILDDYKKTKAEHKMNFIIQSNEIKTINDKTMELEKK